VKSRPQGHADIYQALVNEQLAAGNREQDDRAQIYDSQVSKTRYRHGLR